MLADDSVLSLAIFKALARCVGLSPDSESASALIQEAYAEPENPVSPSRDTDVIYYYLSRDASSADLQQAHLPAVSYSGVPPGGSSTDSGAAGTRPVSIQSFQAFLLNIIAYGPHSRSNAHQIRSRLFIDGANQPRALLRAAGIYPIPTPPEPELLWEQHGSVWRRRSDPDNLPPSLRHPGSHPAGRKRHSGDIHQKIGVPGGQFVRYAFRTGGTV